MTPFERKCLAHFQDPNRRADYGAQILEIIRKLKLWMDNNPARVPAVQWNFPRGMMLIGELGPAIDNHYLTLNTAAEEMVRFACDLEQHTVMMLYMALELIEKEQNGTL